jgi:hypothetical protein
MSAVRAFVKLRALHRLEVWGKYEPLFLVRSISLCRRIRPEIMHAHLTQMNIVWGIAGQSGLLYE